MNEIVTTTQTIIEAENLSKTYLDAGTPLEIFSGLNLNITCAQGIAIWGPSGCGKSTLLNVLSGLDAPTSGKVKIAGVDLKTLTGSKMATFRSKYLGFIFQFYHLISELNALENVMLPLMIGQPGITRTEAERKAIHWLSKVSMQKRAEHYPTQLSGGEQQRVAIARALVTDPAVIFCDEPTGNLDLKTAGLIGDIIQSLYRDESKTVIMVTHDNTIAQKADKVWDMAKRDWI